MQYIGNNLIESGNVLSGLEFLDDDDQGGSARGIVVDDNDFIIVANYDRGLDVYSIDGSGTLTPEDNDDQGGNAMGVVINDDDFIIVANDTRGVDVYSIDGSGTLTPEDNDDQTRDTTCIALTDSYFVVGCGMDGIDSYSIDGSGNLTFEDNDTQTGSVNGIAVDSNDIIIAAHTGQGIKTYTIDGSGTLTYVDSGDLRAVAVAVTANGHIVAAGDETGVHTYAVDSEGYLTYLSTDLTSNDGWGVAVDSNDYVYVANGGSGLYIYSINASGILSYIAKHEPTAGFAYHVGFVTDYAVVANGLGGVFSCEFDYAANGEYPYTNLYNRRPGKPFEAISTSSAIIIDLGTATSVDSVALIGHNIDSGATIVLEGNATNSWGAPAKTETITHVSTNMYKIFTSGSYRFWRLNVTGAAANVRVGELVMGVSVELTNNYKWGFKRGRAYKNKVHKTEYGQRYTYKLYNQRHYTLSFAASDTTLTELETLHSTVEGGYKPFVFINSDSEAKYVTMSDELEITQTYTNLNECETTLTEMPVGKEL